MTKRETYSITPLGILTIALGNPHEAERVWTALCLAAFRSADGEEPAILCGPVGGRFVGVVKSKAKRKGGGK